MRATPYAVLLSEARNGRQRLATSVLFGAAARLDASGEHRKAMELFQEASLWCASESGGGSEVASAARFFMKAVQHDASGSASVALPFFKAAAALLPS